MKCDGGALNYSFLLALLVIIQKWYSFSYSVSSTFMELPIICHCNNSFKDYIYKLENYFYFPSSYAFDVGPNHSPYLGQISVKKQTEILNLL